MSEKQFKLSSETVLQYQIMDNDTDLNENEVVDLLNSLSDKTDEQQVIINRLQRYNDILHDENLFNTMKMFEFMKEKGVFDEFYERIKKEVFGDE